MKKILALILCLLLSCSTLVACSTEEKYDESKAQLNIGAFLGGIGTAYLEPIIDSFEKDYSKYDFGNGKIGVEVHVNEDKTAYESASLNADGKKKKEDIFILNELTYTSLRENGILADITSIVTDKVYNDNGNLGGTNKSIADKMLPVYQNFYNVGTSSEKYYAIPYAAAPMGIVYDKDLFFETKYRYFFNVIFDLNRSEKFILGKIFLNKYK